MEQRAAEPEQRRVEEVLTRDSGVEAEVAVVGHVASIAARR
jgi:hypothetical protein